MCPLRQLPPSDLDAVVKAGQEYSLRFEQHHDVAPHAKEQADQYKEKLAEIEKSDRQIPGALVDLARAIADTQPIAGTVSISELTQQLITHDPQFLGDMRTGVAGIERHTFGDEVGARQVESVQTLSELIAYIQQVQRRWEATQAQAYADAGFDAPSTEYLLGSEYAGQIPRLTRSYQNYSNREFGALGAQLAELLKPLDGGLLEEASRDDEESRRVVTEFKDWLMLYQQQAQSR